MLKTNLKRVVRTGFFNFWRNSTVSLASVLVMMVTLFTIGFISLSGALLDNALTVLREKIDINVTFVPTAKEEDILSIKQSLEALPEVALVTYLTREEALAAFKERNAHRQSILGALDELGYNPLGAVLNIQARDPSQYASVADFLDSDNALSSQDVDIIDVINYFENKVAIDRLTSIIHSADRVGFLLTIVLVFISILIAFNTLRLTIYIARDEISVMRLVGASTAYVEGPFVVLGVIYGLMAGVLTLLIFVPITYWFGTGTERFLDGFNIFSYYLRHLPEFVLIILGSGVLIGALSSLLAIRKYLKV